MKKTILILLLTVIILAPSSMFAQRSGFRVHTELQGPQKPRLGFMIHGGAGVIRRGSLSPEREKQYREKLEEAVMAGYKALKEDKSALDAVEIATKILEDSPLFNAGKGAVFTNDGKNELDASIMDGKTQNAGAVAGVRRIKNPISLARAVMEKSPHVMLIGDGAEKFAEEQKFELVDPKYFWTQERWDGLQRAIKAEKERSDAGMNDKPDDRYGTVGAVALDKDGNLAAATSTGGMTNKRWGRVGDAPIIGAGTYANNQSCAVSATGWGEYFIRLSVARDICSLYEYRAMPLQMAADTVIKEKLQKLGGDGGVIVIDRFGKMAISFNSEGMYRAYIDENEKPVVDIYGGEAEDK